MSKSGVKSENFNKLVIFFFFTTKCIYFSKALNLTFSTVRMIIFSEEKMKECAESGTSFGAMPCSLTCFYNP